MIIDGKKYDFIPTDDVLLAKDYNGFIGQDGMFYKVSYKNSHTPTHNDWAVEYLFYLKDKEPNPKKRMKIINGELSCKGSMEYLINGLGFIYYSHSTNKNHYNRPIIIFPKKQLRFKVDINDKQKIMLYKIMCANGEFEYINNDIQEFITKEEHEKYVDDYIKKRVEEEQRK